MYPGLGGITEVSNGVLLTFGTCPPDRQGAARPLLPHPDPTSLDNSFFKKDVDTQYKFEGGGLTVRWKYHAQTDSWRISGFRVK